jgi:hypothetical protein
MTRERRPFRAGPGMFEYIVIIALVIFVVILILFFMGTSTDIFTGSEIGL